MTMDTLDLEDDLDEDFDPRPPQVAATRRCLSCQRNFPSHSAGNRICTRCRKLDVWQTAISEYQY